jgi:hypothetical protein
VTTGDNSQTTEALRKYVLDQWARGVTMFDIGYRAGIAPRRALKIVHTARINGDPRAAPHGPGPVKRG